MEQDEKSEKPKRKPKSDAAIGGMVATFALLFLAVFVGLFIWLGRLTDGLSGIIRITIAKSGLNILAPGVATNILKLPS